MNFRVFQSYVKEFFLHLDLIDFPTELSFDEWIELLKVTEKELNE